MSTLSEQYRSEFPVSEKLVYFDHSAVAPIPRRTAAAARQVIEEQMNYGAAHYAQWTAGVQAARQSVAKLVKADADEIAFVKNTSQGLIIAAESIPWHEGDNVVTCAIEFPANVYPWLNLERRGVETRLVGARQGRVCLDDLAAAMDRRTRVVALSWVQFSSGFRADLGKLSALCRDRGAYLVIDAIQGVGAQELDLSRYAVDFLCADGHKWLLSVEGCGFLYVRKRLLDELVPTNVGWLSVENPLEFLDYNLELLPTAQRFEEGTLNIAGVHALGASANLLLEAGPRNVEAAIRAVTRALIEGLLSLGLTVTTPLEDSERAGIVTLRHPTLPVEELMQRLHAAGIRCAARAGNLRFSPHFYNDEQEVQVVLEKLREMM